LALVPPGIIPMTGPASLYAGEGFDRTRDHRLAVVMGSNGQTDSTQFVFDPAVVPPGEVYAHDTHQLFMRRGGQKTWTAFPNRVKQAASPWFWIDATPLNRNVAFYSVWGDRPGAMADGRFLKPDDFRPNFPQDDIAGQKAYTDPHHYFCAKSWERALKRRGMKARTVWGDSDDNDYGNPNGYNNNNLPAGARPADAVAWLQDGLNGPGLKTSWLES
jgi:hypothetical protein